MEESNTKKQRRLFIIGLFAIIVMVLSATYAYFQVGTVNNFGTSTINATSNNIGSVILQGNNVNLSMNLSLLDMMPQNSNVTYYASSEGRTTDITEEIVGVATVSPNEDTNYYHCTYTLEVKDNYIGDKNMYNIFKGTQQVNGQTYSPSVNEFVLTVNGVDYDLSLSANSLTKEIPGEFNIKAGQPVNITAGLRFVNINNKNQILLTNSGLNFSIEVKNGTLSCSTYTPAAKTFIALTEDANNASKISKYTGPVTDECSANSCTTVQQAQNVYIVKSNDINNVIFEGYCWKIIRTTETGGIKLLYNGVPTTVGDHQECVANNGVNAMLTAAQMGTSSNTITYSQGGANNSPAYVGYMYNKTSGTLREMLYADDVNKTDSALKSTLENWLINTSHIDESKLEDAVYCNDRSLASNSPATTEELDETYDRSTIGDVYFKNYSQQSTLECTNQTDSFNTTNTKAQTNYKVGFMTEAERYLMTNNNSNYSTVASEQIYWIGSPNRFTGSAVVHRVSAHGDGNASLVNSAYGVRPVVSANMGVQITSGDGYTTSPFMLE